MLRTNSNQPQALNPQFSHKFCIYFILIPDRIEGASHHNGLKSAYLKENLLSEKFQRAQITVTPQNFGSS
jgi:hypothetical protein